MEAISNKKINFLDLSDNAFGPTAIPSFEFFLRTCTHLENLELENNGLGPEGAEMVCNALLQNDKIKLKKLKIIKVVFKLYLISPKKSIDSIRRILFNIK